MVGIIGAMEVEVRSLCAAMGEAQTETAAGMVFHKGSLQGKDVIVVRSGVGKVNAGLCSQILADRCGVSAIINTGVAGSLRPEINIGDIVLSTSAVQYDVDATVFGYQPGEIPQMGIREFPTDERLRRLAAESSRRANPEVGVFAGRIASGDQFVSSREKKKWIKESFDAYCTEMEGAAIAQAAYLNRIPCLIVRAISDKADDSAVMDYDVFEAQAAERSVRLMLELLKVI